MIQAPEAAAVHGFVAKRDSLNRVATARQWAEAADRAVRDAVAESRSMDIPWDEIGAALGMSEVLAQARYQPRFP